MRLYDKFSIPLISKVSHLLISGLLILNVITLLTLPLLVSKIIRVEIGYGYASIREDFKVYVYFLVILYISGACALIILNDLRMIFKSCMKEEVFNRGNVTRLYRMALVTGTIALIFFTKLFVVNSIMTMIIVFVFFMASVFCFIISLLFDQAVDYKEENDLTI